MSKVILFQGDSITDCGRGRDTEDCNLALGAGYPALLAARLLAEQPETDFRMFNRGISGNRVVDLYARWKIDAVNLNPDILSILVGVNDTWHEHARQNGVDPKRYNQIYRMMLDFTLEQLPGVKLVLLEPYVQTGSAADETWVDEINERAAMVKQIASDYGTLFIPLQKMFDEARSRKPEQPFYFLRDGVHPTYAGHYLIARAWYEKVKNAGLI